MDQAGLGDVVEEAWWPRCPITGKLDPLLDRATPADLQTDPPPSDPLCNSAYKYVTPPASYQCTIHQHGSNDIPPAGVNGDPDVCDLTAYWTPALLEWTDHSSYEPDDQTPMTPAYALTYYRNENITDPNTFEEFPSNYAVVAGDQDASSAQDLYKVTWACVQAGAVQPVAPTALIPSECVDQEWGQQDHHPVFLRMVITFPDCVAYAPEANGMIQPIGDGTANADEVWTNDGSDAQTCPTGNPTYHLIPFIQVGVRWNLDTSQFAEAGPTSNGVFDLTNYYLASDFRPDDGQGGHVVDNGASAHADFMSGWTQDTLDVTVGTCLHVGTTLEHRNCGYVEGSGT